MRNVKDFLLIDRGFADLNPIQSGMEACEPGHRAAGMRHYYLLHYVFSGCGVLESGGRVFPVGAGQYFLIRPGEIAGYEADREDPWDYIWIGFNGTLASRFDGLEQPVGDLPPDVFEELRTAALGDFAGWDSMREEYIVTVLHRLLAELFAHRPTRAHYARRVETYIRAMYMQDVSVEQIADMLSLDRRYLSRLFRERYGVTMQEYLINTRLAAAARLLQDGHTVAESAMLSGYRDTFNFSKIFHKKYGVPPREYAEKAENGRPSGSLVE